MKVDELTGFGFKALTLPDGKREIQGVYIGDLLSWVMGRAQA
ncbi:MAG: AraC family transcriptional regulator, partial [Lachnospiraceae bacterium]|nr:AraC family transcriptional regulator [Lachnospiraceae bacterium]